MADAKKKYILIECPHCELYIQIFIHEFNCKIFRHGTFKSNHKQIHPHLQKELCDQLVANDLIFGCGKPYKLMEQNKKWIAVKCDYL